MNKIISGSVYIPFDHYKSAGGPSTFMLNMKRYLDGKGFKYSIKLNKADNIFFPISFSLKTLDEIKKRGGRILQRLDGVYYPSQHGNKYTELNKDIKHIYQDYSDFVIFQSKYSKAQCFEMLGLKNSSEYTIIVNGVNKKIFYPKIDKKITKKITFITTGIFRSEAMLEPIVKALDELKNKYDFELIVAGPVIIDELKDFLNRDYIKYVHKKKIGSIAKLLRKAHIYIHSKLNDNCPNAVLEASSTGLPVVGFDSGAMQELLFFNKELLAYVSNDLFQKYEDFDPGKLKEKIISAVEGYADHKKTAMANSGLYSFDECGEKYIEVFKKFV
jgi:glycosyltransferase involved in cell wall biosynthesis